MLTNSGRDPVQTLKSLGMPQVRATLDLTRTTHENRRHWKDADAFSGRSAYPLIERKIARERSRLEASNNSWYAGMLRTASNHIVGPGPRVQFTTNNPLLNARLEAEWMHFATQIHFAEKLRIAIETYWRDGEVFGMRTRNPGARIDLNLRLYEPDQVSQPYQYIRDISIEDGIRVDSLGRMVECWIYDFHPGDAMGGIGNSISGKWYPGSDVWHLFRADRPGQLRGIPRCTPAIDHLAKMRRFGVATLSAAEQAANWAVFIKTTSNQVVPARPNQDLMAVEWERNAMNFMPAGWEPAMLEPKHPATTNEMYQRTELMYFCRCANMPYSLAAGTSKDSNFSAAKMDIVNLWWPEVRSEQDQLTTIVMFPMIGWFLEECVFVDGILEGAPPIDQITYNVVWPPLPQADEIDVANAANTRMSTGQTSPRQESLFRGEDYDSKVRTAASDYGVSEQEYKRALFNKHFGVKPDVPDAQAPNPATQAALLDQLFAKEQVAA